MTKRFVIPFFLLLLSTSLMAQPEAPCYERFLREAKQAQDQLDFNKAISKLEAAEICPDKPLDHNLDELLQQVNEEKIHVIQAAREAADSMKHIAQQSEQKALQQLVISESNRLGFLSNREREKGNTEGALKLAYRAMTMAGTEASVAVQRAFGDAVFRATLRELKGQGEQENNRIKKHKAAIRSLTFSKDGQLLLTVSQDSTVIVWRNNGEIVLHLHQFTHAVLSASFSSDAKQLLTASGSEVILWDLNGQKVQQFQGPQDLVYETLFSNHEEWIAACSRDRMIYVWNRSNGELRHRYPESQAATLQVQFSPDDRYLLGRSADKSLRIWNLSGQLIQQISHQGLYMVGATFGPASDEVLTYTVDHALQIWNINNGQLIREITKQHQRMIRQVVVAPDQNGFLSCSSDQLSILWDHSGMERLRLDDHLKMVNAAKFSEDGQYIITCSADGTAKFYAQDGQLLMNLYGFSDGEMDLPIKHYNNWIAGIDRQMGVYLCQNPQPYYLQMQNQPPPPFTEEEKIKYAIEDFKKQH